MNELMSEYLGAESISVLPGIQVGAPRQQVMDESGAELTSDELQFSLSIRLTL